MAKRHLKFSLAVVIILAMVLTTACVNNTNYPGTINVVEVDKAIEDKANDAKVIIVDARSKEAYDKGHLLGAINISIEEMVVETTVPNMLPSKAEFEQLMSRKGISNDSIVYVYDDNEGIFAARLWWTMHVYGHDSCLIINGGSSAIAKEVGTSGLSAESTMLTESQYTAKDANLSMVVSLDEMKNIVDAANEDVRILDVRSVAEYAEGFIPGAVLYPHTQNLYKDGTFMSSRDLALFYQDAGFEKEDTIIVYCKTSVRASQTVALLQEAGYKHLRIYDGAWLEWSSNMDVTAPVEGEAPVGPSDGS